MLGLNLLCLLALNRVAEFHTELERLPANGRKGRKWEAVGNRLRYRQDNQQEEDGIRSLGDGTDCLKGICDL